MEALPVSNTTRKGPSEIRRAPHETLRRDNTHGRAGQSVSQSAVAGVSIEWNRISSRRSPGPSGTVRARVVTLLVEGIKPVRAVAASRVWATSGSAVRIFQR